ncbi:ATP-binding protein [Methanocella arvoryzae]|uniref:Carbon monoxide dehydrogenase maturation factor (Accessory nickel-insertion protein) n=1 Tax=Methanocella arvoryzae (strain DSM 22066 / NBRC 105507 / MRE50) TaxID=351160 RepID=Q0W5L0_METAR|nr:AAA family ATPase [Methanocella arvoryzae]CAJ36333.1 putative carbon monoxide dehydrogenase maturation factor (accessory nickel-insertion protein) [Methanocella arvoryzae MRE50]
MKIAICGKGGSGKSTITALLAKSMARRGRRVLVVDMDESNLGLPLYLGMKGHDSLLAQLGGKAEYGKRAQGARLSGKSIFDSKWKFEDIPADMAGEKDGIRLLSVGKIQKFGEGCACPIGTLSRQFFDNLIMDEKDVDDIRDVVIMDTAAGVEHFGRSVEKGFDYVIAVVEPAYESVVLAKQIRDMASGHVSRTLFVVNKADAETRETIIQALGSEDVAAVLPADKSLLKASVTGSELTMAVKEIDDLADMLERDHYQSK